MTAKRRDANNLVKDYIIFLKKQQKTETNLSETTVLIMFNKSLT